MMPKGLMQAEDEGPEETMQEGGVEEPEHGGEKSGPELDASLVYEMAMKLLSTPEATQKLMQAVQGAKDVGTAIGKLAGVLVVKISDELEARDMPISDESVMGQSGALARVLTAIYQTVNENGMELPMQDSLIQAYTVAEADLEQVFQGEQSVPDEEPEPEAGPPPGLMGMGA
jgi:hypothetical protein